MAIKIIEPSVEMLPQPRTFIEAQKQAELVGRVSHRSEDSITEDSYKGFIERMLKNEHLSVLEFCTIYLKIMYNKCTMEEYSVLKELAQNKYSRCIWSITNNEEDIAYVTTNLRVVKENPEYEILLKYWSTPEELHPKRVAFCIHTSISVSRQGNRSRSLSVLEESTRYVNYSKEKHGGDIKLSYGSTMAKLGSIETWNAILNNEEGVEISEMSNSIIAFAESVYRANNSYKTLIKEGLQAQEAREVLPLCTATKVYWCAFTDDWEHFLKLRRSNAAHPDIRNIATKIGEFLGR